MGVESGVMAYPEEEGARKYGRERGDDGEEEEQEEEEDCPGT